MSFGIYTDIPSIHDLIRELYERGGILVASAGNMDMERIAYPAAYEEVIAVAAVEKGSVRKTSYSNYGGGVSVSARGDVKYERKFGKRDRIKVRTEVHGTSFSAARVTGVIAEILATSERPLTREDALRKLRDIAHSFRGDDYFKDGKLGFGVVGEYVRLRELWPSSFFFWVLFTSIGFFLFFRPTRTGLIISVDGRKVHDVPLHSSLKDVARLNWLLSLMAGLAAFFYSCGNVFESVFRDFNREMFILTAIWFGWIGLNMMVDFFIPSRRVEIPVRQIVSP